MTEGVKDLVLEVANEVQKLGRTNFSVFALQAKISGVLTGINLVGVWLEAGGGERIWTETASLLVAFNKKSLLATPDLEVLIANVNKEFLPSSKKIFLFGHFVNPDLRTEHQLEKFAEGLSKGFLHGMNLYRGYDSLLLVKRKEFVLQHLSVIKGEIEKLF